MGTLALIALGSNLGDRLATLDSAVVALGETAGIEVRAVSSYHQTIPVGGPPNQGSFLNASALLEVSLEPNELLHSLQEIERRSGRLREIAWSARTLDLDLLLYDDAVIGRNPRISFTDRPADSSLLVPHPWLPFRRFVLAPSAEIAPDLIDPVTHSSLLQLLHNLDRRPSRLSLLGNRGPRFDRLHERITEGLRPRNALVKKTETSDNSMYVDFGQKKPTTGIKTSSEWTQSEVPINLDSDQWIVTKEYLACDFRSSLKLRPSTLPPPTFLAVLPFTLDQQSALQARFEHQVKVSDSLPPIFSFASAAPVANTDKESSQLDEEFLSALLSACEASRAGHVG